MRSAIVLMAAVLAMGIVKAPAEKAGFPCGRPYLREGLDGRKGTDSC